MLGPRVFVVVLVLSLPVCTEATLLLGKVLAGKALAGKALAGKALAGKVLAGKLNYDLDERGGSVLQGAHNPTPIPETDPCGCWNSCPCDYDRDYDRYNDNARYDDDNKSSLLGSLLSHKLRLLGLGKK